MDELFCCVPLPLSAAFMIKSVIMMSNRCLPKCFLGNWWRLKKLILQRTNLIFILNDWFHCQICLLSLIKWHNTSLQLLKYRCSLYSSARMPLFPQFACAKCRGCCLRTISPFGSADESVYCELDREDVRNRAREVEGESEPKEHSVFFSEEYPESGSSKMEFEGEKPALKQFGRCQGWPFGMRRSAVTVPPLLVSPADSWMWHKKNLVTRSSMNTDRKK